MARTSRNGAPAANVDAFDSIDMDDMFGDGGDDFLDGIADDLGLDQMGDITNNMDIPNNTEEETPPDPKEEKPAPTPAPAPAVEEPPKRRKTKRKTKSPVLLDEEEEANEAPSKKKRKTTKTGTGKKKNSKKDKDKDKDKDKEKEKEKEEVKPEPPKSKSKLKGILPTQMQRHASSSSGPSTPGSGAVAAAGQFGGRQKRGHVLPLSRSNSDKLKTKNRASFKSAAAAAATTVTSSSTDATSTSTSGPDQKTKVKKSAPATTVASAPEPVAPKKPPPFAPPIPQTTFCGLKPSNTMFYPFMPALPAEPSIKNRKQYPAIDRLHSSFTAIINHAPNAPKGSNGAVPVPDTESIHRLMHETLKDMTPSGAQNSATGVQDDKKSSISTAVGTLRQTVSSMEKPKLAADLFSACSLLKRQYDFLQQNLSNMERWCKDNFTEADYTTTYGSPEKKQKESANDNILSKFKKPLIRVKVRCSTFKEPKLSGPLYALLPPSVVPPPSTVAASGEQNKEKKPTKKRKSSSVTSDPSATAAATAAAAAATAAAAAAAATSTIVTAAEKEVVIKTYPELRPTKRRQFITEHVAHTAKELEAACISRTASFCQAIDRRHNDLKKMVEEDEVLVIHTAAMWQYIEKAGYFSEISEEALNDTLRSVWAPEVKHDIARDVQTSDNSQPKRIRTEEESRRTARQSVFNGLQSLLVDVSSGADDDDDESEDSENGEDEDESLPHDNFDERLSALDPTLPPGAKLADLSALSVDERTHMHIRRAGMLVNQPRLGPIQSSNGAASNSSRGRKDSSGDGAPGGQSTDGGKLEDVIERMSAHLLELNKVNNARASFLESAARTHINASPGGNRKRKAEKEAALIAKCHALQRKRKDSKAKSSKPNTATKDEYALPW